jgi:hypothetical protein
MVIEKDGQEPLDLDPMIERRWYVVDNFDGKGDATKRVKHMERLHKMVFGRGFEQLDD